MEKNEYKIVISNGPTSKSKIVEGIIFKNWIKLDYGIGSNCEYNNLKYVIAGGNARDGTPMHKMCTVRGFKRIKLYRKNSKIKVRKRVHSRYLSEYIAQIFLKPLKLVTGESS